MSLKRSEAHGANQMHASLPDRPQDFACSAAGLAFLVSHWCPLTPLQPTASKVPAVPRARAGSVLASCLPLLLPKDSTTPLRHHHCCRRRVYRAAPRRFLSRLMEFPLVRNTCNSEGCWMVARPACLGTSTGLMMGMRKLCPQECGTAVGQGTREVEIPMPGSFQGSAGQNHS